MFHSDDIAKLLLRIAAGIMLFHGIHKMLHGIDGIKALVAGSGLPQFFAYGIFLGEVVAPLMILAGFYSRAAALLMAFTMLNAIFLAHGGEIFSLGKHGAPAIELPLLYLLLSIAVALFGPGKFSINRK
jgi:putative oxidoreductase